jgi:selenocysteine-specific elongation factor
MSKNVSESIKHLESVKLYYFSEETTARVKLFNQKAVQPGESVYCQLLLDTELYASKKDVAVIRKVNPAITVAGIEILNEQGEFANRKDETYQKNIEMYASGETESLVLSFLKNNVLVHMEDLRKKEFDITDVSDTEYIKIETYFIHKDNLSKLHKQTLGALEEFHKTNKYVNGLNKQELKSKLGLEVKSRVLNGILDLFDEVYYKDYVKLKSFEISLTEEEMKMKRRIIDYLGETFKPPKYNDVYMYFQSKEFENVFFSLVKKGEIIKIDDDIFLHKQQFERLIHSLSTFAESHEYIQLSDARDILDASRRYVVPYLEYLDKNGYTIRKENGRIWRK